MTADTQQIPDIVATPAWSALQRHHDEIGEKHLREFFAEDPQRGTELALTVRDLYIDFSKHRVTRETLQLLIDLARTAGLEQRRDAMFSGVHINTSEGRAVLHTALRDPIGVELRHRPGCRNIMWSSDYPHSETTFPHSHKSIEHDLAGCSAADCDWIPAGCAEEFYGISVKR